MCSLKIKIVLQISDEILALLIAALGFKWSPLWHWISLLVNHLSVHIRKTISHSYMTYTETVTSWFLLNLKVSELRETYYRLEISETCGRYKTTRVAANLKAKILFWGSQIQVRELRVPIHTYIIRTDVDQFCGLLGNQLRFKIHQNQSSDILQHSLNRLTGDRWLKF